MAEELARIMFRSVLSMSPAIDKVATWLLVGVGATLALIVANLEQTSAFIGASSVRIALLLLLVAGLLGILEKYTSVRVGVHVHAEEHIQEKITPFLDRSEAPDQMQPDDLVNALAQIMTVVPWYQRRYARKVLQASLADPLYGPKLAARMFNRQVAYAVLELLLVVAVIVYVALNVTAP